MMATVQASSTATVPASPPFMKGSLIWQKRGPLPVWAWLLIGLALLLLVVIWRRNRAESPGPTSTTDLPSNQSAGPVFVVPGAATPAVNVIMPPTTPATVPPAGGRGDPPTTPPPPAKTPVPLDLDRRIVGVGTYTSSNPPWNSTISGIAAYFGLSVPWEKLWEYNGDLRSLRGQPNLIRPGDKVYIPNAWITRNR